MSCILHIETSTSACSVAVSEDGQNVFKKEDLNGPSHAVSLGIFVDEALSNAHFIDGIRPLAGMMFPLAEKAIAEQDFKDVAYFEPFYLKEFVAGTPKKLI